MLKSKITITTNMLKQDNNNNKYVKKQDNNSNKYVKAR